MGDTELSAETAHNLSHGITTDATGAPRNGVGAVVAASVAGTAIEFYDFYIYAIASVLIFPTIFFLLTRPVAGCWRRWRC